MDLNLKNIFQSNSQSSSGSAASAFMRVWEKIHMALFFLIMLGFIAFGWQIWQQSLSDTTWSEQEKQEYLKSQNQGAVFNEAAFKQVMDDLKLRRERSGREYEPIKDLYKAY